MNCYDAKKLVKSLSRSTAGSKKAGERRGRRFVQLGGVSQPAAEKAE
jgi:hypothetical protein